jgi:hypothetical protein
MPASAVRKSDAHPYLLRQSQPLRESICSLSNCTSLFLEGILGNYGGGCYPIFMGYRTLSIHVWTGVGASERGGKRLFDTGAGVLKITHDHFAGPSPSARFVANAGIQRRWLRTTGAVACGRPAG